MEEMFANLIRAVCRHPESVSVTKLPNPGEFTIDIDTFCVRTDPSDVGRVIGRNGTVIQAFQTIATVMALMRGQPSVALRIVNPRREERREGGRP